jgi:hypothetical protein
MTGTDGAQIMRLSCSVALLDDECNVDETIENKYSARSKDYRSRVTKVTYNFRWPGEDEKARCNSKTRKYVLDL